ncbi:MAG: sensor domain-containing protein [Streptosporangiales bacterium]
MSTRPCRYRLRLYRNPLHQLVAGSTWRAAWFLLAYLVFGWLLWGCVLAATLTTVILAITLAGIPLLIGTAAVIRGCANAERWRLRGVLAEPVRGGYRVARPPGILNQVRTRWRDPATWRDFGYLFGLFPLLWAVDLAVIVVWLVLLAGIALPAWYWAPPETFNNGQSAHGVQFGYFPNGPHGPGAWGVFVDTMPKALLAAAVFLVLFLLFNYVLVLTARLHARIASALLRAPGDPLADAKEVLTHPGPLGKLHPETPLLPETPLHPETMHPAT